MSPDVSSEVIAWLLRSDPAIRWQVLRDIVRAPADAVAAERARVANEGWGAELLARQREDGGWVDNGWSANLFSLHRLKEFGADPKDPAADRALSLVRERVTWGPGFWNNPFFEGEVEPCINGNTLAIGAYFGVISEKLLQRLLSEQLSDGGWNCEAERGSVVSSFHSTICVLEALLAVEQARGARPEVSAARAGGEEYLLKRRMMRRLSTGEIVKEEWTKFSWPCTWHYDVLRGLDYMRNAARRPEDRMAEAIALVESRRQPDGRWLLDLAHKDTAEFDMGEREGEPSRWITLRALRVLDWYRAASAP